MKPTTTPGSPAGNAGAAGGRAAARRGMLQRIATITGRFTVALLAGGAIGWAAGALLFASVLAIVFSPLFLVGLPVFLAVTLWLVRPLARLERRRAGWITGQPVPEGYRPLHGSVRARARTVLTDPATWRDLAWLPVQFLAGLSGLIALTLLATGVFGVFQPIVRAIVPHAVAYSFIVPITSTGRAFAVVPLGLIILVAAWLLCWRATMLGSAQLSAWLLSPGESAQLRAQTQHLAQTRAETVDAREAELRRIERDLHDGAQARLVWLAMSLGMAEEEIYRNPDAAIRLVAEARSAADTALTELRDLVRGIHPPVLTERGLGAAVEALALASAVPIDADVHLDQRLPAPLESAVYYIVAEAVANIARHSRADWAFVRIWREENRLRLLIHDDGRGGAEPERGTGLRGIERRLAAFDGHLSVSSPPGGPTELSAELPLPRDR